MLKAVLTSNLLNNITNRTIFTSPVVSIKKIIVEKKGDTTVIEGHILPSPREGKLIEVKDPAKKDACPVCRLGLNIKHTDVLILKQFVRLKDNTMLPRRITGLCEKQQRRIGYMVAMAVEAGLLNDRPHYYMDKTLRRAKIQYNRYFDETTIDKMPDPGPKKKKEYRTL